MTTPRKSLSIVKVATEQSFSKVGDVVHYNIKATNTGSVALTNVLVTDPKVSEPRCTPSVPVASLAVGAEINCTASHTITAADMTAGSFLNTACVDDGASGADQVCSDVTTPRKSLSIVKVATDSSFSKVGDVVHYTIKATNTGSVALTNVLVDGSEGHEPRVYASGSGWRLWRLVLRSTAPRRTRSRRRTWTPVRS